jgi:DNA-binding transcriptional MerR regulator
MLKDNRKRTRIAPPISPDEVTYSTREVSKIARVSLRQLQWWDEQHLVSPRHQGHRRVYRAEEVLEVALIAELRRKGFSPQKLRRVIRYLQRDMGRRLADVLRGDSEIHLLTDGKSIYLEDSRDRVIDILKNARQPMFLVCVTDQARRLSPAPKKSVRSEPSSMLLRRSRAV